ncbi:hypothetical protein TKK_0008851 [Trichogramma kaykai]
MGKTHHKSDKSRHKRSKYRKFCRSPSSDSSRSRSRSSSICSVSSNSTSTIIIRDARRDRILKPNNDQRFPLNHVEVNYGNPQPSCSNQRDFTVYVDDNNLQTNYENPRPSCSNENPRRDFTGSIDNNNPSQILPSSYLEMGLKKKNISSKFIGLISNQIKSTGQLCLEIWSEYCQKKGIDMYDPNLNEILEFFYEKNSERAQWEVLEKLKKILPCIIKTDICNNTLIEFFFEALKNERPKLEKVPTSLFRKISQLQKDNNYWLNVFKQKDEIGTIVVVTKFNEVVNIITEQDFETLLIQTALNM